MDPPDHAGPDRRVQRRHARAGARPLSVVPGCARVTTDAADAELVADLLWYLGATAVGERQRGRRVELEAGFATTDDADDAVASLARRGIAAHAVDVGPALEAALDAWMAYARPVRIGRLHVRPSWLVTADDPPADGEQVVVLDPSRAFGSGSHPSTIACLAAVDRYSGPGIAALDVGCGTGVLGIAAAVLGASPVVAVDTDAVAVSTTASNATRNGVTVDARLGSIDQADGRFDLIVANVGASTVVALAAELAARTAPGGHVVTAGLHPSRADEVSSALAAAGLTEVERSTDEAWCCLIHHSAGPAEQHCRTRTHSSRTTEGAR